MIATQGLGNGGPLKVLATINDPVMGRCEGIGTLGLGVELNEYIHKQIGIIGQKGYMPELKASHITATTIGPTDPATIARMRADQKFR